MRTWTREYSRVWVRDGGVLNEDMDDDEPIIWIRNHAPPLPRDAMPEPELQQEPEIGDWDGDEDEDEEDIE